MANIQGPAGGIASRPVNVLFHPLLSLWLCPSFLRVAIPYTTKCKNPNLIMLATVLRTGAGEPVSTTANMASNRSGCGAAPVLRTHVAYAGG